MTCKYQELTPLRPVSYGVNEANEYTTITNPPYKDIIGAALNDSTVTVNGGAADRKTEYFHREITATNASGPCWTPTSVAVTNGSTGWSTNGGLVLLAQNQSLSYDASGNLTNDGIWSYRWDSENRLVEMIMAENVSNLSATQRTRLEFAYDYQGRRIRKTVSNWVSGNWSLITHHLFVYDGWNLIAILNSDLQPLTSFTWGLDLSGSEQGAGGVGGLLFESQIAKPQTPNPVYVCYDGNGNVMALVATDGTISARYEYSPFGEAVRATGPVAEANPLRWSTKLMDPESGLVYYGFRYYSASLGRWISRDPAQEGCGINLFSFARNAPVMLVDSDGRIIPILAGIAIGAVVGAAVGALTSPADERLRGAMIGGFAGGIGAGTGIIAAGLTYGATIGGALIGGGVSGGGEKYIRYASENYLADKDNPLSMNKGQLGGILLAASAGALSGAVIVGSAMRLGAIDKIDDTLLDAAIGLAGSVGVGGASFCLWGGERAAAAAIRLGSQATNNWDTLTGE